MDSNVALTNRKSVARGDVFAPARSAADADTRVEHFAMERPTPTGEDDELDGGWYFYKA
jgi:hypothetical protein